MPEVESPKCVLEEGVREQYGEEYMYLGGVRYVRELKKSANFGEGR